MKDLTSTAKFHVGQKVYWKVNGRIDIITAIKKDHFGDIRYMTKEITDTIPAKIGMAYESYLEAICV